MNTDTRTLLLGVLDARVETAGLRWLEQALSALVVPVDVNRLLTAYAGATRRLGRMAVCGPDDAPAPTGLPDDTRLDHWGLDEVGRAVLLLTLREAVPDTTRYVELVRACYDAGTAREQQSWLRSLPLLPERKRFLDAAVNACRTNIVPLFEAIACENSYPGRHFPDLNFNQLVLKGLFNDIALSRVKLLADRLNPELSRMANDYVTEREAAGRSVPADIWLVVAPHVDPSGLERVHRYLDHESPDHRYWAAVGLGQAGRSASRSRLDERRQRESDPRVLAAMTDAMNGLTH